MKRSVRLLSIVAATVLMPMAAPAALAGEIVKCVDTSGHVTLTDQPCASGSTSVTLAQDADANAAPAPAAQRHVLPATELRHGAWKRPVAVAQPVRLAGDVATLKAAHRTLLMQDAKPRLAGLD